MVRGSNRRWLGRSLLAVVVALGAAACSDGEPAGAPTSTPPEPSEPSTPSPEPSPIPPYEIEDETFTSTRYGYSITLDGLWRVTEASTDLPEGEVPGAEGAGADRISRRDGGTFLLIIAAQPVPDGTSLDTFAGDFAADLSSQFPECGAPTSAEPITIAGHDARSQTNLCTDGVSVWNALSVQGERGYIVGCLAPEGNEAADRQLCEQVLSAFTFPT
jgi:hypothetical protein